MNTKHSRKGISCRLPMMAGICAVALGLASTGTQAFLGACHQTVYFEFFREPVFGSRPFRGIGASETHTSITSNALSSFISSKFGRTDWTSSTWNALERISEANAQVDDDQVTSAKHFDAENATVAQKRLLDLKAAVKRDLDDQSVPVSQARKDFGSALHTLQDFYSHSSWTDQHPDPAHYQPLLGRADASHPDQPADLGFAAASVKACLTYPWWQSLVDGVMTSGYFPREDRPPPPGFDKCLHGGVAVLKDFRKINVLEPNSYLLRGINKDTMDPLFSPYALWWPAIHATAARQATLGTYQFLDDIAHEITTEQLKKLLGITWSTSFVVDTSDAMATSFGGLGTLFGAALDAVGEEPHRYVLSYFGNGQPSGASVAFLASPAALDQALAAAFASNGSGGSDCQGDSLGAVLRGVAGSEPGSVLLLFAGRAAADAHLSDAVLGLAASRNVHLYPVLLGNCAAGDATYTSLAAETGGLPLVIAEDEVQRASEMLASTVARDDAVQLLSIVDQYPSETMYQVPVDQLSELTVLVSSAGEFPTVNVFDADGIPVMPDDPGVEFSFLSRAMAISVQDPTPGTWRVYVANSPSTTFVKINAISRIQFQSFEVGVPGPLAIDGPDEFPGSPWRDQEVWAMAGISAGAADQVELSGVTLRSLNFAAGQTLQVDDSGDLGSLQSGPVEPGRFLGRLILDDAAGRFMAYAAGSYVSSIDQQTYTFQRVVPQLTSTQTVTLSNPEAQRLRAGETTALTFQAKNHGAKQRFALSFIDDKGFVQSWSPAEVELDTGASANVTVRITPPAGTANGTSDTVVALIKGLADPAVKNSSVVTQGLTDVPPTLGRPGVTMEVIGPNQLSSGRYELDLRFRGTGPGDAESFVVTKLGFKTLSPGTGTVAYSDPALAAALPFEIANFDKDAGLTVRLNLNVPDTVNRFSITASGSVRASDGKSYSFSQSEVILR